MSYGSKLHGATEVAIDVFAEKYEAKYDKPVGKALALSTYPQAARVARSSCGRCRGFERTLGAVTTCRIDGHHRARAVSLHRRCEADASH
jgi:hypothetical protein